MVISKELKDSVWNTYIGKVFEARCYCCNKMISALNFKCGRIKGDDITIKNLRPICQICKDDKSKRKYKHRDELNIHVVDYLEFIKIGELKKICDENNVQMKCSFYKEDYIKSIFDYTKKHQLKRTRISIGELNLLKIDGLKKIVFGYDIQIKDAMHRDNLTEVILNHFK